MIKEILKGNNIPIKTDLKFSKKSNKEITNNKNRRINSVLYNFIKYKKINLKKKSINNIFEKANSAKAIINKNKPNDSDNKNNSSSNSKLYKKKNNSNIIKLNIRDNNTFTIKRKNKISREISNNINSLNFEEKKIFTENYRNKSNNIILEYDKKFDGDDWKNQYQNGCLTQKHKYAKDFKISKSSFNNKLLLNNLKQEFEIRCLKKKIKNLKNNRMLLIQELNDIKKKNNKLNNKIIQDENRKQTIVYNTINIYKYNDKIISDEKDYNLKNIFAYLKDLKYNFENAIVKDLFISGIELLLFLSKNTSDKNNNNQLNNIYYKITNLINIKNKYINDIKKFNIIKFENKKYYNYCIGLLKNLNLNGIDELYKYLKNIKSNNDKQIRKIIKMKHLLYDENKPKKHQKITSSVDDLINSKKFCTYNYEDLQKFFIENNKKNNHKSNFSAKVSNMTIKSEKSNIFCLNDKGNYIESENSNLGNKTCKNRRNYYLEKRKEFNNKMNLFEKFRKKKRIKSNIINTDKIGENEKENNYLYYSYKEKIRNIPHNNKTYKKFNLKQISKENIISKNNLTCYNENKNQINNNRIYNYEISQLNNNINKSLNLKLGKSNNELKDKIEESNYINSIKIKKKSFNIKVPSLKMMKNFIFNKTINYNKK